MDPRELVNTGSEIIEQAGRMGAQVRLFGSIAALARCPSLESHDGLKHEYSGLDLIAPVAAWKVLPDVFISRGFRMKVKTAGHANFSREGLSVDVWGTAFREYYAFDLSRRVSREPLTLPLADILLLILQRVEMTKIDIQDAIALLLDHPVEDGRDPEAIDRGYIVRLANRNWGLWTTIFDNTVMLEHIFDTYLKLEEAKIAWRRLELVQEVLDGKPKTFRWHLRSIPSKHLKWYSQPPKEASPEGIQVRW